MSCTKIYHKSPMLDDAVQLGSSEPRLKGQGVLGGNLPKHPPPGFGSVLLAHRQGLDTGSSLKMDGGYLPMRIGPSKEGTASTKPTNMVAGSPNLYEEIDLKAKIIRLDL